MLAFAARRAVAMVATLAVISVVIFAVLEVLPGDPALFMLGTEAQPDTLKALRAEMHLDQPPVEQYLTWIGGMATGRLGRSYTYDVPVSGLIAGRLVVTLPLAGLAMLLSTALALPLGILAAAKRGRAGDAAVAVFSQAGMAVPGFWIGILLVLLFSLRLRWFASGGFPGWDAGLAAGLKALVLPAVALALPEAAILARVTRAAMLDTMAEDYVRTARAKGLGPAAILWRHVLVNALSPITTLAGLQLGFLIAGAVVIENVFYLPGLGQLVFQAIEQRDLIVVRDTVMLLAALVVAINTAVDLIHAAIDPRPSVAR